MLLLPLGRGEEGRGGLRLDSREAMLTGGDSGPAVVPGKVGESLLIQAIRHEDGLVMPPKKPKLTEPTIAAFEPGSTRGPRTRPRADRRHRVPRRCSKPANTGRSGRSKKPGRPTVTDAAWVKNPIDAFVLAKLEERRWRPSPPAGPRRMAPPRDVRPDRPAADARGDRGVRG